MSLAFTFTSTKVVCRRNRGKQPEEPSQPAEVLAGSPSNWVLQVQPLCLHLDQLWTGKASGQAELFSKECLYSLKICTLPIDVFMQVLSQQGERQRGLLQRLAAQHLAGFVLQPGNPVVLPLMGQDVVFRVRT